MKKILVIDDETDICSMLKDYLQMEGCLVYTILIPPDHPANLDVLIQNFDCALSHPDANDLVKLKEAVMDPSF